MTDTPAPNLNDISAQLAALTQLVTQGFAEARQERESGFATAKADRESIRDATRQVLAGIQQQLDEARQEREAGFLESLQESERAAEEITTKLNQEIETAADRHADVVSRLIRIEHKVESNARSIESITPSRRQRP